MTLRVLLSSLLVWAASACTAQNAYLTNGFMPRFAKAGTDYPIEVRVRNSAATPLVTFRVDWRWNSGAVQQGNWQSTTGITGNQYWPYTHPVSFNIPQGPGVLKVWVVGNGDTDPTNDTLTFPLTALNNWVEKNMLLDMWTATWCPVCPPANIVGNALSADPRYVVAKHHANDEFSTAASTAYYDHYDVTFTPAGMIDQGEYGSYVANPAQNQWSTELALRKLGVSPVDLSLGTSYNAITRELSITLDATFTYSMPGTFAVNVFVLEDEVPGAQANAPAGYVHQQLVREVLGGADGNTTVLAQPPVPGTTYPSTWNWTLPGGILPEHVRVVGLVTHRLDGESYTLNVKASAPLVVGVSEQLMADGLRVFPNPAQEACWVELPEGRGQAVVRIFAADGRMVLGEQQVLAQGPVPMEGFADLAPGVYLLRVEQDQHFWERRLVKQ